jgi:hypothetical protein
MTSRSKEEQQQKKFDQIFGQRKERTIDYILLILLCSYGLYLMRAMFVGQGYFYNYDLNQHLTESVYVATVLLPKYHELVGWNPFYYLGWPQGQFNPPASYLVYSLLYYLLSWTLSPLAIFKIMIAIFFVLQGVSIYFAAIGFGLGRISAFIGGFIALGTAGGFETGGPLAALYYGMYEYALAIALIPLILAVFHQSFVRKSSPLVLLTALLVAFDFLLHTLAGMFLILALLVYTIAELFRSGFFDDVNGNRLRQTSKTILKFGVVVLIMAGICSFWIIPAYSNRGFYSSQSSLVTELGNYATTYNDLHLGFIFGEQSSPLISNIFHFASTPVLTPMLYSPDQQIMSLTTPAFYQLILALAVIGAGVSLVRAKSRFPILIVLFLIGTFIFISLGPNYYQALWHIQIFHYFDLRPGRAAAVARVFLAIIGGAGIGESFNLANLGIKRISIPNMTTLLEIGTILVIAFLGLTIFVNSYALMNQLPLGYTTNQLSGGSEVQQVLSWIKQSVPNDTRVAFEEYPQDGHPQHLFAIAPLETGDQEIGSNYGFWWSGADTSNAISQVLTSQDYTGSSLYSTLAGLNAGYVVVWGNAASGISVYPSNFKLVQNIGEFQIYKLKGFSPSYVSVQNGTGNAAVMSFQPQELFIHLQNVTAGTSLLVRESYYTNWVAFAQGNEFPVLSENLSLPLMKATFMKIIIPENGTYNITLVYTATRSDTIGNAISYFSFFAFFLASLFAVLDSRTKYPIAEYLALVVRKTSDVVRSAMVLNAPAKGENREEGV